jgi:hypothetical protein
MKKKLEFKLSITVDDDYVSVELGDLDDNLPATADYNQTLSTSISIKDTTYVTGSTWHGSEEMWYTTYKK